MYASPVKKTDILLYALKKKKQETICAKKEQLEVTNASVSASNR